MKGPNFSWPKWLGDLVMTGRLANLKPSAQRVLLGIAPHFSDEGRCYPGQRRIRYLLKMSDTAIRNGIDDLVKAGILRADKAHGRTTSYYAKTSPDTHDPGTVPWDSSVGHPRSLVPHDPGTVPWDSSVGHPRSLVPHDPGTVPWDSSVGEFDYTHQRSLGEPPHDPGTKPFKEPERLSAELRAAPPADSENDPEADPDLDGSDPPDSSRSLIWQELAGEGVGEPTRSTLEDLLLDLADGPTALRALRHLVGEAKRNATGPVAGYLVALVRREAEAVVLAIRAGTLDRVVAVKSAEKPNHWQAVEQNRIDHESEAEAKRARWKARVEACEASLDLLQPDRLARLWEEAKRGVSPSRGLRRLGEIVTDPLLDREARGAIAIVMAEEQENLEPRREGEA